MKRVLLGFALVFVLLRVQPSLAQKLGVGNGDGSQDTIDPGEATLGFENGDGSEDTFNLDTGEVTLGIGNGSGRQDTFSLGSDDDDEE